MLTGRAARSTTWAVMDDWVDQWSTRSRPRGGAAPPSTPRKAPEPAPSRTSSKTKIGSNPTRRYGSSASRNLAR